MRKAIFIQFIRVLLAALLLNSIIFYIASSSRMLKTARKDMLYTLETLDCILDYQGDLNKQVKQMESVIGKNQSRLTLILSDGKVAADTGVDASGMDNHLAREEVVEAIKTGKGHAARYSHTLKKTMLYVAFRSSHQDLILRLGVPFLGLREYITLLLPAAWLSFAIAVFVSLGAADRLVSSVTKPILQLAHEMKKVHGSAMDLEITPCPYEEINRRNVRPPETVRRTIGKRTHHSPGIFQQRFPRTKNPLNLHPGLRRTLGTEQHQRRHHKTGLHLPN